MNECADQTLASIASAARHDLKQSLHVVSLYLQLAQAQLPEEHPAAAALGRATAALDQQRALIRRLREVAEVPGPVKGRAELVGAVERCAEAHPSTRLQGDLSERWVPLPTGRLDQLLAYLLGAAAGGGADLRLELSEEGEQAVVTVRGGLCSLADVPSWTDEESEAQRWLLGRLARASGAQLTVTEGDDATCWRLVLP